MTEETKSPASARADLGETNPTVFLSKTNPASLAHQVAQGLRSGARSVIASCVLLVEAERALEGDPIAREDFRVALARENIIPRRSARLGEFDKSKLAMLRKIGQHSALLLSDELATYLQPGYSVLYYIVRYYEVLPGQHETRLARLLDDFAREGHLTRDFLVSKVSEIEKGVDPEADASGSSWPATATGDRFDLVLATPSHSELRRLREFPSDSLRCLRVHQQISGQAVAVVHARLVDLPVVENKLLPGCGFDSITNIILRSMPSRPDVTTAEVIVIARRSSGDATPDLDWLSEDLDIHALASRIVPDAQNRLHLFASEETEGYLCVIGDANLEPAQ